jgi:DNA-binding transcriptional LysR family regulator
MDAADLRVFEAVARLGGMGRAAVELNTVQSNVTARIRQLEHRLGTALFRRHARGVALTPAGTRLLPYASRLAGLLAEAQAAARDDGTPRGPLVVGSLETTAALRLSHALSGFAASYPAVDLTLRTGTTCELLAQVLDRQLEGAFVCGQVVHAELTAETFFTEELVLLAPLRIASLASLNADPELRIVVLRRGCSYRQRLEELLTRRGIPAPRVLEFGTLEAVFACVAGGLGITLLPRAVIGQVWPSERVALHALEPRDAVVETVFVRRRGAYVSSALTAFLTGLRAEAAAPLRVAAE